MDKEAKGKWSEKSIEVIQPNHPDLKKPKTPKASEPKPD